MGLVLEGSGSVTGGSAGRRSGCGSRPGNRKTGNSPAPGRRQGQAAARAAAATANGPTAPADGAFQLASPQRWPSDAARRGRATATMGDRCCGNDIHGPSLRLADPAEQHRCPIVAVAAPELAAECPVCQEQDLSGGNREPGTGTGNRKEPATRSAGAALPRLTPLPSRYVCQSQGCRSRNIAGTSMLPRGRAANNIGGPGVRFSWSEAGPGRSCPGTGGTSGWFLRPQGAPGARDRSGGMPQIPEIPGEMVMPGRWGWRGLGVAICLIAWAVALMRSRWKIAVAGSGRTPH